ncbi:MAG: DegT/DnrJ/EryC1/StrS family aminotransferase [Desulfobaccales bacterium]|nr:DegT/DnrJ/EryC1/StrS family aminotransferase [Desulfobaccales bacterium]
MEVKYLDLPQQFDDPELIRAVADLFKTCQFIMGPEVARFEEKFAELCGTRFALGVNSGTDALFLALKVLGVGPGHEVITVSNSFIATAGAIVAAGARPVFVDVAQDYNINPTLIEAALTSRTKAILPVHLTGNPANLPKILDIARKHGLVVVEDAAQAIGAAINGQPVGSFGHLGCFSLHPLKNLNVAGDGGMMTTNEEEVYLQLKKMRNHGLKNRDEIDFFAYNSRLDTLQALVAAHRLKRLDQITAQRRKNAGLYDELLSSPEDEVIIPPRRPNFTQVFHTYVIQVRDRGNLIRHLAAKRIETKVHYPIPIHLQAPCRQMGWKPGDLPETEKQAAHILSLPIHQHLTLEQVGYVAHTIRDFYGRR